VVLTLAAVLWIKAAVSRDSLVEVTRYSFAGAFGGFALHWIFQRFASLVPTAESARRSAMIGFLILTPVAAILLDSQGSQPSSVMVLALTVAAAAAMAGALWSIVLLAHDAFTEWRHLRNRNVRDLTPAGAHS
jgi:predicted membrane protein